jgi:nicotinate-nucleotide--dimethylbenzimidazole phosphoribosyltransferase
MLQTIMAGTSVSAVFARLFQVDLRVVDVGSRTPPAVEPDVHFRSARVTAGSADLSSGPALTLEQFEKAWQIGQQEVLAAHAEGFAVLALGEMGIGNTTPAACLTSYITGVDPHLATGRGAGADDATLARKHMIVKSAVAQAHQLCSTTNQQTALAALSGYEIAAMAGFIAGAAQQGSAVVLDGYVTTAAALVAEVLQPGCTEILIAAHRSAEPGHKAALDYLNLVPLLEWDMRLGEGSGALLALPMIEAAAALLTQVASLPQGAQA